MRSKQGFALDTGRSLLLSALFILSMIGITLLNVSRLQSSIPSEREIMLRNATQPAEDVTGSAPPSLSQTLSNRQNPVISGPALAATGADDLVKF